MRRPEHTFIAVHVTAAQADRIEEMIGPSFTLAEYPEGAGASSDDETPAYFLALTEPGRAIFQQQLGGTS